MSKRKGRASGAVSFLAGLGTGYLNAKTQKDRDDRQAKIDAENAEIRALQRDELKQAREDRQTLRDAGADRVALPGTAVIASTGTNLYADPEQAEAAAAEARIEAEMTGTDPAGVKTQAATGVTGRMAKGHQITTDPVDVAAINSPEAKSKRVIAALDGIDPLKAMEARHVQTQRDREGVKFTQEQEAYAKKLKEEGVIDALRALRSGNAQGVAEAFNRGGQYRIEGDVELVKEMREIPGLGQVPTYTAKGSMKLPDGSLKPVSFNSHDLGMSLMPYEQAVGLQMRGAEAKDRGLLRAAQAEAASARAEASRVRAAAGTGAKGFDALDGWDPKQAQAAATKMVDEATVGKEITPQERARLINQQVFALRDSWQKESTNRHAMQVASSELREAKDPSSYAATYAKAQQIGMTPEVLKSLGFEPPPAALKPTAASGTRQAASTPAPISGAAQPAPAAARGTGAAPALNPVAQALGVRGDGSSLDKALAVSVPKVEAAGAAIATAKAQLAAAARSNDPQAVTRYAQLLQAARNDVDALLKDMNQPQAEKVRAAVGY